MEFKVFIKNIFYWLSRISISFAILYIVKNILSDGKNNNIIFEITFIVVSAIILTILFSFLSSKDWLAKVVIKISLIIFIPSFILEGIIIGLLLMYNVKGEGGMAAFPLLVPLFLSFNILFIFLSYRKELWGIVWFIYGLTFLSLNFHQLYISPNSRIYDSSFYSSGIFILSGLLFLISYFFNKKPKIVLILIFVGLIMGGLYFYAHSKIYYSIMTNRSFDSAWSLQYLSQSLSDASKKVFDDYSSFFDCKLDDKCRSYTLNDYIKNLSEFKKLVDQYDIIVQKNKVQLDVKEFNKNLLEKKYNLFLQLYNDYLIPIDSAYAKHNKVNANYSNALNKNDLTLLRQYSLEGKELQDKERELFVGLNDFYKINKKILEDSFYSIRCDLNVNLSACLK